MLLYWCEAVMEWSPVLDAGVPGRVLAHLVSRRDLGSNIEADPANQF